tara:strand:- start:438 stop:662 length:225 start_codon:yes stop_codon:yes gene_type:complete
MLILRYLIEKNADKATLSGFVKVLYLGRLYIIVLTKKQLVCVEYKKEEASGEASRVYPAWQELFDLVSGLIVRQ